MLPDTRKRYEYVGESQARGIGVWIRGAKVNERGSWLEDIRYIVPVDRKPDDWRENRALIVKSVQRVFPNLPLDRYKGGVARFASNGVKIEAYTAGYRDPAKDTSY